MSSSTKASARLAPWFRTAERTQTAKKKRPRARHPRCTLRHSRHTRGQLKHRTRTSTIKPRGIILFFTVIYNTQYRPSRPFLSVALVSRLRAARARDALHSDARAGPSSSDSNTERESRRALASRRSGIASPRIANARTRPNLRLIDRRPNARTRPTLRLIARDRSSTEREDACESSINRSRSIVDRTSAMDSRCLHRVTTGVALGAAVGGAVGACYGTYEAFAYKVPGLLKVRHIGRATVGSSALFGLFLGAGSLLQCGRR